MVTLIGSLALCLLTLRASPTGGELDERPAAPSEWGFRPLERERLERTPPAFSWRPQTQAASYELQASRDASFERVDYQQSSIEWNVHCPARAFEAGDWSWRFRALDAHGQATPWSRVRAFTIAPEARAFCLPPRAELLQRIPEEHPRLFLRPEQLPALRAAARADARTSFAELEAACAAWLAEPPSSEEPPLYEAGMQRGSDPWRAIWWGNRQRTIEVLEAAATLAFCWRISDEEPYAELARRLLLECAHWNPKGATGYRYNDEAGMPYAYHFSRAYSLLQPRLAESERELCRAVMRARGREMYAALAPRHFWTPYNSHANRAWHFLGEVGIAFHGELPEADDWVWFAANVFANVYPVWSDADGGWHEGSAYWTSYLSRFTQWADVQRAALGLDAYQLPFFARAGDRALYLMPPGTKGGGFGDLNASRTSAQARELMTTFSSQAQNPYWRWYVEQLGGPDPGPGWIGFLRGAAPSVAARELGDLPSSHCFRGTGIAVLQSSLASASDNVELIFKSSPFGTQSHGYESQNAFLLYAFGERLLIRTGKRDSYGSTHHREWMWQTKSVNSITVDGVGQLAHSPAARGLVTGFRSQPGAHWVEGEAAEAYGGRLDSFRRGILFLEPDLIVVHDRLRAREASSFEWLLHAPTPFVELEAGERGVGDAEGAGARRFLVTNGAAACRITSFDPDLDWSQTQRFDPPPRERVHLVEHHLTAATRTPSREKSFLTIIRPYRSASEAPPSVRLETVSERQVLRTTLAGQALWIEIQADGRLRAHAEAGADEQALEFDTHPE